MIKEPPSSARAIKKVQTSADLVVVGGGMAGVCGAITAARAGLKVVLMQDRPVLGGNGSSEVRLWVLGATCHMSNNNRWSREGGVINEIMMENLWRNPEGNPLIFDTVLLEKVLSEPNITLLLNTACFEVDKSSPDRIRAVRGYCSQSETMHEIAAPLFCDASGDGVVGFLAGAAFRMGAEAKDEFGEGFAPTGEFGHLLGHSIYFYSKDVGRPVSFVAPSFALRDVEGKIPRHREFHARDHGCRLWWIEWGGRLDTIHETENIKWELWRVVYGVWDYIKNSGKFPDAANLTLEWVGHIPGKRESRRFEGDYILRQQDVVERRLHEDAVAFGGWSIDLHPADGVFAEIAGSHHLHSKGIYQIPYRSYYSRNIENLFLAGRIISATHVAFGSTRVMATCALGAQAVGQAAALCRKYDEMPRDITRPERMQELQQGLLRNGHHIPAVAWNEPRDIARSAKVTASSAFSLASLPDGAPPVPLDRARATLIPLAPGAVPGVSIVVDAEADTELTLELRTTSGPWHHSPDVLLGARTVAVAAGRNCRIDVDFAASMDRHGYGFLCLSKADGVSVHTSPLRLTGLAQLQHTRTERSLPVGGEDFDIFSAERRPNGHLFALHLDPAPEPFAPENVLNGWQRPTDRPNAWVAATDDPTPSITLEWEGPRTIREIELCFDGDFDHAMESVLMGHPERAVPQCVKRYEILDDQDRVLIAADDNHLSLAQHRIEPLTTRRLTVRVLETWGAPAALFEIRCFA